MYVSASGVLSRNKELVIADLINTNMNLDIKDIPLTKYGIIQNFSKDNLEDSLLILRLMVLDFLDENLMDLVELSKIEYENKKFTITFVYSGKEIQSIIEAKS